MQLWTNLMQKPPPSFNTRMWRTWPSWLHRPDKNKKKERKKFNEKIDQMSADGDSHDGDGVRIVLGLGHAHQERALLKKKKEKKRKKRKERKTK